MRTLIDRFLIRAEEISASPKILRTIQQLKKFDQHNSAMVAECLEQWRIKSASNEEHAILKMISDRRSTMEDKNEIIEIDDFGAGFNGKKKQVNIGQIAVQNSRSHSWLSLMFRLVRTLKPTTMLELGTCLGISGMYCASALRLNGNGTLVTIEGAESYANIAKENFTSLQLNNVVQYTGRFSDALDSVLKQHAPIDFVFIDGHHDGEATIRYFEKIYPSLAPSSWIIFDDISWSSGMKRAWKTIASDPRITFSADLSLIGICHLTR